MQMEKSSTFYFSTRINYKLYNREMLILKGEIKMDAMQLLWLSILGKTILGGIVIFGFIKLLNYFGEEEA